MHCGSIVVLSSQVVLDLSICRKRNILKSWWDFLLRNQHLSSLNFWRERCSRIILKGALTSWSTIRYGLLVITNNMNLYTLVTWQYSVMTVHTIIWQHSVVCIQSHDNTVWCFCSIVWCVHHYIVTWQYLLSFYQVPYHKSQIIEWLTDDIKNQFNSVTVLQPEDNISEYQARNRAM